MAKVPYQWTARDAQREKAGFQKGVSAEAQLVTPYGHVPTNLPGAKELKSGDKQDIDLALAYGLPGWRDRFKDAITKNKDATHVLVWEPIPDNLLGATTLGELCKNLRSKQGAAYPAYLYEDTELGKAPLAAGAKPGPDSDASYHLKMPQLMFDYWENTELRHKVIGTGGYAYDMDTRKIPIDPKMKWKALTLRPIPTKVSVKLDPKVATQNVVADVDIEVLKGELQALGTLVSRTQELLLKSYDQMQQRASLITPFSALHVMFQCCAASSIGPDQASCQTALGYAERILKVVNKKMLETPMEELISDAKRPAVQAAAAQGIHGPPLTSHSGDMAATVRANCDKMRGKLFGDSSLKLACRNVFAGAIDQGVFDSPRIQNLLWATVVTITSSLDTIGSQPVSESEVDPLFEWLHAAPADVAKAGKDVKGASAVELMLSVVGFTTSNRVTAKDAVNFGGLAVSLQGPPCLSLALTSLAAAWKLPIAARAASPGGGRSFAKMDALQTDTLKALEKYKQFSQIGELVAAVKASDLEKVVKLREGLGKAIAGSFEGSMRWKAFTSVLQIVAFVASCKKAGDSFMKASEWGSPKNSLAEIVDMTSMASKGAKLLLGHWETVLTKTGDLHKSTLELVKGAGTVLSYTSCVLGMIKGACRISEGIKEGDEVKITLGKMEFMGCAVLMMGMLTGNPGVQAFGLALTAAAAIGTLTYEISKEDRAKNKTNAVAKSFLQWAEGHPFFPTVRDDILADHEGLKKLLKDQEIPYAANQSDPRGDAIVESLRRAGFSLNQIQAIVDTPIVVFEPTYMTGGSSMLKVPPSY